jgi:hypothetical protein
MIFQANGTWDQARVAILISDKTDLKVGQKVLKIIQEIIRVYIYNKHICNKHIHTKFWHINFIKQTLQDIDSNTK